jgi:hypothetical protein
MLLFDVDASLPAAQAQVDSLAGSNAWAGAPWSSAVAGNIGLAGLNANDTPFLAVSSYPATPKVSKSGPGATIDASSDALSSTAQAAAGGPASNQASAGKISASGSSSCGNDGTVRALADNAVDLFDVEGVLRIGAVRSHARVEIGPTGQRTLDSTMEVVGATVLGQPVAITDRGVVAGGSAIPLPDDPEAKTLADAGITVRYIAAAKDDQHGQVFAPGLEVVVTRAVQGAGTGPINTTYTLGRTYARAATSTDQASTGVQAAAAPGISQLSEPPSQGAAPAAANAPAAPPALAPTPASSGSAVSTSGRVAAGDRPMAVAMPNASFAGVYSTMGAAVLLFVAAWLIFERLGVRIRWR